MYCSHWIAHYCTCGMTGSMRGSLPVALYPRRSRRGRVHWRSVYRLQVSCRLLQVIPKTGSTAPHGKSTGTGHMRLSMPLHSDREDRDKYLSLIARKRMPSNHRSTIAKECLTTVFLAKSLQRSYTDALHVCLQCYRCCTNAIASTKEIRGSHY